MTLLVLAFLAGCVVGPCLLAFVGVLTLARAAGRPKRVSGPIPVVTERMKLARYFAEQAREDAFVERVQQELHQRRMQAVGDNTLWH